MRYEILQSFKGSQTGAVTEEFTAGTQTELSDYLVSCIPADWVRPVKSADAPSLARGPRLDPAGETGEIANKAVVSDGAGGNPMKRGKK